MMGRPATFGIFLLATLSCALNAKESITEISIGAIRTELEREAVGYAIKHRPTNDIYLASSSGFTDATPIIEILTGGEDSFDGLIAKLQGHRSFLPQNFYANEGNVGSCSECAFHVVPFAIGIETDRNLENVALLGEV
ncbi:MAG: hypothetical protein KJO62_03855 [Gammaproteobacteria bacterium]|nr:hypothetical protein [Gammaproteobacteria bacterium]